MKVKGEGEERKAKKALAWSGKKYEVTSFVQPGFANCSVGFHKWDDGFRKSLELFRNDGHFCFVLRVKEQWTSVYTGQTSTALMMGAFKTIDDVIKAIEKEEGGAK